MDGRVKPGHDKRLQKIRIFDMLIFMTRLDIPPTMVIAAARS